MSLIRPVSRPFHTNSGSPLMQLWYYLQKWNRAGLKLTPQPPPELLYRRRDGEKAHRSCLEKAVWQGLQWRTHTAFIGFLWKSHFRTCAHVAGADAAEDEEVDVTTVDPIVAFCSRWGTIIQSTINLFFISKYCLSQTWFCPFIHLQSPTTILSLQTLYAEVRLHDILLW